MYCKSLLHYVVIAILIEYSVSVKSLLLTRQWWCWIGLYPTVVAGGTEIPRSWLAPCTRYQAVQLMMGSGKKSRQP